MSYIALYRKWRPLKFEDVVEQQHIVTILKNTVKTNKIAHAYLFCGTHGTGKTTMAKIFARAVNCLEPVDGEPCNECVVCKGILDGSNLDVIEIDAASNNSVDNIREIRDEVMYTPSQSRYKVYIIDEVHMLSIGAFNALLKTLEEPPRHVIFILATTESNKIPATILSRCQRFDFKRISVKSIAGRLKNIVNNMGISCKENVLELIAKVSDGALRDAISILDQCIALGKDEIMYEDVLSTVGMMTTDFVIDMVDYILKKDIAGIVKKIDDILFEGKDIVQFLKELIQYFRDILICKVAKTAESIIDVSKDVFDKMVEQGKSIEEDAVVFIIKDLSELENKIKWSQNQKVLLEVALIKICKYDFSSNDILEKIKALEIKLENMGNNNIVIEESPKKNIIKAEKQASVKEKPKKRTVMTVGQEYEAWGHIINKVKQDKKMALWSYISDSRAFILDSDTIGIVFTNLTAYEMVTKFENINIIKEFIDEREGRDIKIKTACKDMEIKDSAYGKKTKEDFIKKAQKIAEDNNIEINVLEE